MDEMKLLADFGRELDREPPNALVRQRNRLLDAVENAGTGTAARRLRRPRPLLAGAAAVLVAGALLAVVLPAGHGSSAGPHIASGSPTTDVALAGWSVKAEADGEVEVTLRELTDAAAVRRALAAAKVPARVWVVPTSVADPKTWAALSAPIVGCATDYLQMKQILQTTGIAGLGFPNTGAREVVFTVDPSLLPAKTVVNIVLYTLDGAADGYYLSVSKPTDNACTPYQK
jgi:hypothetical protein